MITNNKTSTKSSNYQSQVTQSQVTQTEPTDRFDFSKIKNLKNITIYLHQKSKSKSKSKNPKNYPEAQTSTNSVKLTPYQQMILEKEKVRHILKQRKDNNRVLKRYYSHIAKEQSNHNKLQHQYYHQIPGRKHILSKIHNTNNSEKLQVLDTSIGHIHATNNSSKSNLNDFLFLTSNNSSKNNLNDFRFLTSEGPHKQEIRNQTNKPYKKFSNKINLSPLLIKPLSKITKLTSDSSSAIPKSFKIVDKKIVVKENSSNHDKIKVSKVKFESFKKLANNQKIFYNVDNTSNSKANTRNNNYENTKNETTNKYIKNAADKYIVENTEENIEITESNNDEKNEYVVEGNDENIEINESNNDENNEYVVEGNDENLDESNK